MIYVIADDLTGAAEIAGICARYGLLTSFSLGEVRTVDAYDAHVIATETRQQSLSDARKEIRKLCEALPTDALLFKKTDSAGQDPLFYRPRIPGMVVEDRRAFPKHEVLETGQ